MKFPPDIASLMMAELQETLRLPDSDVVKLDHIWNAMAFVHASLLAHRLRATVGDTVHMGPFKGMQLASEAMVKSYGPQLLGSYEHELHPVVERIIATPYQAILNIGCNFGYYAIGLARRMSQAKIYAFDIEEKQQNKCRAMAALNNVQDRVIVDGLFKGENFVVYEKQRTLVLMDIEGGEMSLLDPGMYPALKKMDVLVELHDLMNPVISQTIRERFAATHDIEMIYNRAALFDLGSFAPKGFYVEPLDNFLIAWESRGGPTPWAYMRAQSQD